MGQLSAHGVGAADSRHRAGAALWVGLQTLAFLCKCFLPRLPLNKKSFMQQIQGNDAPGGGRHLGSLWV